MDSLLAVGLMLSGALPGLAAGLVGQRLWRRRQALPIEHARLWLRAGYLYVAAFVLVGVMSTADAKVDPAVVAGIWIGLPTIAAVLGLSILGERQRLTLLQFPDRDTMLRRCEQARQDLRVLATLLARDLDEAIGAQAVLANAGLVGARAREHNVLSQTIGSLRSAIGRCHELDARYGLQIRRVKLTEPDDEDGQRTLDTLWSVQAELAKASAEVVEARMVCSERLRLSCENLAWMIEPKAVKTA